MGDMEKAVQRVMRDAKELWVEMGLNDEQCAARMNHFTEMIGAALDDLLRQVRPPSLSRLFLSHFTHNTTHRKSPSVMPSARD